MKICLIALISVFSFQMANACIGESQLIAAVKDAQMTEQNTCVVSIGEIHSLRENMACEQVIDIMEMAEKGIQTSVSQSGACAYKAGDTISGIVVKNADDSLSLGN